MLHIIYRASDLDKPDVRPSYYSKLLCLKSLLVAVEKINDFSFTLYYDGDKGDELIDELQNMIPQSKIMRLSKAGNARSFWKAYVDALELPQNDWVYFVEDDYLHTVDALEKLVDCMNSIPDADYITLYDHPVRYATDYSFGLDIPHRVNKIYISNKHHWRTQESTCMTFAAQVSVLQNDRTIFDKYVHQVSVPEDRELFRKLQGLSGYESGSPFRLLIGPVPSLTTHCHLPWIAPIINWEEVARKVSQ